MCFEERRNNMKNIMKQNEDFIVIGLTGRTGSGCTDAAKIFASSFKELEFPQITAGADGFKDDIERDLRIIERYASEHWIRFDIINSRTIISSFLLENINEFFEKIIIKNSKFEEFFSKNTTDKKTSERSNDDKVTIISDYLYNIIKERLENDISKLNFNLNKMKISKLLPDKINDFTCNDNLLFKKFKSANYNNIAELVDEISALYTCENNDSSRSRHIEEIESLLNIISMLIAKKILVSTKKEFWNNVSIINNIIDDVSDRNDPKFKRYYKHRNLFSFVFAKTLMPYIGDSIYDFINYCDLSYTKLFQKFGNSIRRYGRVVWDTNVEKSDIISTQHSDGVNQKNTNTVKSDIFSIPRRIVKFIKALRHPFSKKIKINRPVRIAIDSIKSVFEANYLRERYSSFYLFAISSDDKIRQERLMKKNLTYEDIKYIDWNEYSSEGYKVYIKDKNKSDKYENKFRENINKNNDIYSDETRKYAYEKQLQQFYLQDVATSIESADAFISNNHTDDIDKNMELRWSIVRNICLIMFPGLIMPTPIERCMQIAFSAKCNSGCLSRQVGAVVTDKDFNILSIGWNDVPCGDISCSRKNLVDLCKLEDREAYSNYEISNPEFRERINNYRYREAMLRNKLIGLPLRYCFKDIHIDEKNPMRSRAMHAEEKALANCGDRCQGGYLFTTSSPCEMCSKNAKNHQIKRIYYIELYPGISETQYSDSGDKNNRAEHILFTGAVGRAYMQMYTPIMPQKDILESLGIYDWFMKKE